MNAVQCNRCGLFAMNPHDPQPRYSDSHPLPKGWVWMYASLGNGRLKITGDFCSRSCAAQSLAEANPTHGEQIKPPS